MAGVSGYYLIECLVTVSLVTLLMASGFMLSTSYLMAVQKSLGCMVLFTELQAGQLLALSRDMDVTFQVTDNRLRRTHPEESHSIPSFPNQILRLSNASGIGFTDRGHTKFAGTLFIDDDPSLAVSLGVGFGKVTLK